MEAQTGTVEVSAGAYHNTFAQLKDRTIISDVSKGIDIRPSMSQFYNAQVKALTAETGGAGTAGYALVPVAVDQRIVDQSRKFTPAVEIIPRVTNFGLTADYNKLTAKGSAVTASEDPSLADQDDTYDRASTAIKYIYAVGRVTGQAQAAVPGYALDGISSTGAGLGGAGFGTTNAMNAKQLAVLVKARAIKEKEESLIMNGDASTDATQFSGIVKLMSTTNTVDKSTTAISLDDITTAIQYAYDDGGRPNVAFCSSSVYSDLIKLVQAKFGYMNSEKAAFWGMTTLTIRTMVGDIPIIPSMYLSNSSGSKCIYFMDLDVCEMRVLQDMTYEDLAKTGDSQKFFLKTYEALIIRNPAFCSSVTGISA